METERLALAAGIPLLDDDAEWTIDVALDGADQVDPQLNLVKGGGGALLKEKIVAQAAGRFLVLIDETKQVAQEAMRLETARDVNNYLREQTRRILPEVFN